VGPGPADDDCVPTLTVAGISSQCQPIRINCPGNPTTQRKSLKMEDGNCSSGGYSVTTGESGNTVTLAQFRYSGGAKLSPFFH